SSGSMYIRFTINNVNHDFAASYSSNRSVTATNFVNNHSATLSTLGIGVSNIGESIYFNGRDVNSITTTAGNLNGTKSLPQAPIANAGPDQFILDKPGESSNNRRIVLNGYSNLRTTAQDGQNI